MRFPLLWLSLLSVALALGGCAAPTRFARAGFEVHSFTHDATTGLIGNLRHRGDETATYTGSSPDVIVADTLDLKELTGIDARVIHLAGHTGGSLIVVLGDVALVGDLLRGSIVGSGAETHFYQCDLELNRRNVERVLVQLAPEAKLFFVGHFGPVSREAVQDRFH